MPRTVTLGADPELFVYPAVPRNQYAVPACGLFGGEKGRPVMSETGAGGWLEDGVTLELNPVATRTAHELAMNVIKLRDEVHTKILVPKKLKTMANNSAWFRLDDLQKHPQALQFGCAPDISAYNPSEQRGVPMQKAAQDLGPDVRFAGGHVHIGISDWPNELPKYIAVKLMDLLVGVGYKRVSESRPLERDDYYGLPGLYRDTSYGFEYRTPTSNWVAELSDGRNMFLFRTQLFAEVLADFEHTKSDLVRIYNSVNWEEFYNEFSRKQFARIPASLSPEILEDGWIYAGPYGFRLMDYSNTINRATGEKIRVPNPLYDLPIGHTFSGYTLTTAGNTMQDVEMQDVEVAIVAAALAVPENAVVQENADPDVELLYNIHMNAIRDVDALHPILVNFYNVDPEDGNKLFATVTCHKGHLVAVLPALINMEFEGFEVLNPNELAVYMAEGSDTQFDDIQDMFANFRNDVRVHGRR